MSRIALVTLLICLVTGLALAATADDLAKSANKTIREAENAYFNGDITQADTMLDQGQAELEKLKAQDPSHKQIKNLQNKHDRLRDRIDKKLAAEAPAQPKTPTVGSPSVKVPGASTVSAASELSSGASSTLKSAERSMDHAVDRLTQARESLDAGNYDRFESRLACAESDLAEAQTMLDRAGRSYKLTADNPQAAPVFQRYDDISTQISDLDEEAGQKQNAAIAAQTQIEAGSKALDDQWLPRIEPYTEYGNTSFIKGPNTNDSALLAEQDAVVNKAVAALAEYDQTVPEGAASWDLGEAVKKLRFKVEVYQNDRRSGLGNLSGPVERTLGEWENRFAANETWSGDSGTSLFIVRPKKVAHLKEQIAQLNAVDPSVAATYTARLTKVERDNASWTEKREAWDARPRPFPAAKMTNKSLEAEMVGLLKNGGWKVDQLVITDKDWWVLKGEYRYMGTAVLSKDDNGPFWSSVSFKQDATVAGYGPTELWESGDKVRLP